jgi:integrase
MARQRDEEARVLGPYWVERRQAWRIKTVDPRGNGGRGRSVDRYFESWEDADKWRKLNEERLKLLAGKTLERAIPAYDAHLAEKGTGAISRKETVRRLRAFFPDLSTLVGRIDEERAKQLYAEFRQRKTPERTKKDGTVVPGHPISVSYHRSALINVRSFYNFCVEQKWSATNPFVSVKGIGRRNRGKKKHTGDETRKLYAYLIIKAQAGDRAALGVLMALLMALRSSDLTRRLVRDVDLDATQLNVTEGKTEKSNEPRVIPDVLQPLVRKLVAGRSPFEPLFKTPYTESGHHTRRWLEEAMGRFCKAVGLPYVCPHALKSTAGTVLAKRGALANQIAEHLSHEDAEATTMKHYVSRSDVEQAQLARAAEVITGGKGQK